MGRTTPFIHDRPAAEALAAWEEACAAAGCPERLEAVGLRLDEAVGRVTAEPVWARTSSPPFDAAAMDGIAVRAAETVGASETSPVRLEAGAFEVVDTGDPIPGDFDAVVMREDVHTDEGAVELRAAAAPYQHVRSIGEDVSAAELLLPAGHRLRPVDVAAAGAAGATELVVRRRPVVTVIPTGDEIRPVGSELGEGQLPDTNSVMLAAQAEAAGCEAHRFEVTPDVPDEIAAAVRAAAARSDLVVVIAGSSAGRDDHTAAVVAEVGTLAVHGVAVRPGHPVVLGAVEGAPPTPVLGAPGYPVSAALTFDIFAAPLLARLEGAPPPESPVGWWPPRSRAGPACSPRWCGPTACSWFPPSSRATTPARTCRCACSAASARSSARSWPRARTTWCSISRPRPCASATRASRWHRRTSARSGASPRCATGSVMWRARISLTPRLVSTRCRISSGCCRAARFPWCGSCTGSRA